MELYMVTVKETLERTIPIKANNWVEAIDVVEERYNDTEIVLDAEDFAGVSFSAIEAFDYERKLVK